MAERFRTAQILAWSQSDLRPGRQSKNNGQNLVTAVSNHFRDPLTAGENVVVAITSVAVVVA